MNILFRADSSSSIGTGHIMRNLVLAKQYKNANIIFATQELDGNINHKIVESGYGLRLLKSDSKEELLEIIKSSDIELLVIDNYDIDYVFEKYIKENSAVKILSFDDTYEKHYCDILLNHNISADEKRYKGLVPDECELRCGCKYTLLRDEFIKEKSNIKKVSNSVNSYKTIFIAIGGSDSSNLNPKILKVLETFSAIKVNLVTTTANQNLKELEKYVKNRRWIKLHINSNKIAELMNKSDLAIITPSVTANEIYYLEVPFVAIKVAENQLDMYTYLKNNRYDVLSKFKSEKLLKLLIKKEIK